MAVTGDLAATDLVYRTDVAAGLSGPLAGANKLWLSIWSGETIHAYDEYNMFESLVDSKTLSNGVAMEFPITGTVALKTAWNAGVELVGGDATSTTIAVKLDKRPIAAHFEIDNVDLMQTQWEFRSELARQAGLTLANARDKQIAAYIARAAVEDLTWSGSATAGSTNLALDPRAIPAGPVFLSAKFKNLGATINAAATQAERSEAALDALKACEDFVVYLQTINAPTDGVYLAVTPRAFQDIRALGVARTHDQAVSTQPLFGGVAAAGGLGAALTQGMNNLTDSLEYMGVRIIKSNHLPIGDWDTAAKNIGEARYNLAFDDAGVVGLLFQKNAVASLKLQGLKVDTVDDVRRNTTFTVASMMAGTGVLRPECAALLVGATTANSAASYSKGTGKLYASAGTVLADVDAANVGGAEAALARNELRVLFGANFTREMLPTVSDGFPYA
jgi:hypothetical protein